MLIRNLSGLFSGEGFAENDGRYPRLAQADFHAGPVDIAVCDQSRRIRCIGRDLVVGSEEEIVDGAGKVALPGWVDSHTHALFAGSRAGEFFQRWQGQSYLQIARSGGGIAVTQQQTADTSDAALVATLAARFRAMLAAGTAAVEVKSGYGRNGPEELRLLRLIGEAAARVPQLKVVATFLGLHAIPQGRQEHEFVQEMIGLLPLLRAQATARFADCFPELGFFSLEEALDFAGAALAAGLQLKVHADELTDGGSTLAFVERGATSVDHLQHLSPAAVDTLAISSTVGTLLPATSFFLAQPYAPARTLLDSGAKVALATDYNPGSAPELGLSFTARLAAANLRMTPAEILCGLTYNGACALGIENDYGTLAPGKAAAVLLFETGPEIVASSQQLLEHFVLESRNGQLTRCGLLPTGTNRL